MNPSQGRWVTEMQSPPLCSRPQVTRTAVFFQAAKRLAVPEMAPKSAVGWSATALQSPAAAFIAPSYHLACVLHGGKGTISPRDGDDTISEAVCNSAAITAVDPKTPSYHLACVLQGGKGTSTQLRGGLQRLCNHRRRSHLSLINI